MAWAKNMSNSAAGHDLNLSAAKPQFNGKLNGLAAPNLQTTKPKWNEMLPFLVSSFPALPSHFLFSSFLVDCQRGASRQVTQQSCVSLLDMSN